MYWFFVFMTVFGWRVAPITGNTTNLSEACYGKGQSEFCIVSAERYKKPHKFANPDI